MGYPFSFGNYCDYCGYGYIEVKCERCGSIIEICGCNHGQRVCDECIVMGDNQELEEVEKDG